jgi:malonyl-CoA/methylmalonyl-CoA synthetase
MLSALLARPEGDVALVDDRGALSWGELRDRALRVAGALGDLRGRRVALLVRQDADAVASLLGVLFAGGMAVPLSPAYPASELGWFGDDADVDTVILSAEHAGLAAELVRGRRVLASGVAGPAVTPATLAAADPGMLFYTSGTTGKPKGVVLSHGNLAAHTRALVDAWALTGEDRLLHALPLHHLHGLVVALLAPLVGGGSVALLPRFEAARVAARLNDGDVSVYMAVPTMYQKLREHGLSPSTGGA